jgi:ferrochelatase
VTEPAAYDAVLLVSFGGPEGPDEVMPFLQHVVLGRRVPQGRLDAVAKNYLTRGGVSPLNAINRELRDALASQLVRDGVPLPVYWGNRHWHPFVEDAVRQMRDDGVRRALAFITSAYASYSACRQYQDDIAQARERVGAEAPAIDRIRHYFDHPGFIEPFVESTVDALSAVPEHSHLVFTAHSIPEAMAAASGPGGGLYPAQLQAAAQLVSDRVADETGARRPHTLAYQSRAGALDVPWLGPDIVDHLADVKQQGAPGVVVIPIGFTADHMEVVHDLGTVAVAAAAELRLPFALASTPGTHPAFVSMAAELVRERLDVTTPRRALSNLGPAHDRCPLQCCVRRG